MITITAKYHPETTRVIIISDLKDYYTVIENTLEREDRFKVMEAIDVILSEYMIKEEYEEWRDANED